MSTALSRAAMAPRAAPAHIPGVNAIDIPYLSKNRWSPNFVRMRREFRSDVARTRPHVREVVASARRKRKGRDFRNWKASQSWMPKANTINILIAMNVVYYLLQVVIPTFTDVGVRANYRVFQGDWYRLWTSMFLHGGPLHLLINSFTLKSFGPEVQRLFGTTRLLTIYLLSGFLGNVFSLQYGPPYVRSLGASGAIFGLMGALFAYIYRAEKKPTMAQSIVSQRSLLFTMAINALYGMRPGSGIDNYCHAGGFLAGGAVAFLIGPRKGNIFLPTRRRKRRDDGKKNKGDGSIVPPVAIEGILAASIFFAVTSQAPMLIEFLRPMVQGGYQLPSLPDFFGDPSRHIHHPRGFGAGY